MKIENKNDVTTKKVEVKMIKKKLFKEIKNKMKVNNEKCKKGM